MSFMISGPDRFKITLEVVPPDGHNPGPLLDKLLSISDLPFDGFSIASNPVAKPKMSALAFTSLVQKKTKKPGILHTTVRDHNGLGLQAELWGARALGIDTIIAVTGDPSAREASPPVTTVNDMGVYDLIGLARDCGLTPGGVLDFRPEVDGLDREILRVEKKVRAGCRFIVTQPVYDRATAQRITQGLAHIKIPVILGILPLISLKHARFLHDKVAGIAVPKALMASMENHPLTTGMTNAREMMEIARDLAQGACIMPPFNRFDLLRRLF